MRLTQQKERTEEDYSTESIAANRNKEVLILLDSNIILSRGILFSISSDSLVFEM